MNVAGVPGGQWRAEQADYSRLAWAFALSVVIHLLIWGGYSSGKKALAWVEVHRPSWLVPLKLLHKKAPPPVKAPEPPVMVVELKPEPPKFAPYVDVSPAQATAEPPKNPRFESSRNSQAANPDADKETGIPKITGERTDVIKADDVPRRETVALQPLLPPQPQASQEEQPEIKAKPTLAPGDLTLAKPDPNPRKDDGQAERPRPRTLREARARQPEASIPGRKMKQDGGVKRRLEISAMDAKASLFGAYQERLVAAIVQRWYDLLDERAYTMENGGKVVVQFAMHYDGTITGVNVATNTTGAEVLGYVCVKAIEDPAPFEAWPSDMRHEIARGIFDVEFTFLY